MQTKILKEEIHYDGSQLYTHFGYDYGVEGDSIIAFCGGAEVFDHMVDKEDIKNNDRIYSPRMIHFIITLFNENDLEKIILIQRLFMACTVNILNVQKQKYILDGDDILRKKDHAKLSVSIATKSQFAGLIHAALNIMRVPKHSVKVKTCHLNHHHYWTLIMNEFVTQYESIKKAAYKVSAVS